MKPRLTKDGFIVRAKVIHGDAYDYSKVEYVNTKTKVCIICQQHGEFMQAPEKHMAGQGCPKCSGQKLEETNRKRYGVARPLQSKEIRERMASKMQEQYGVTNPMHRPEIQAKQVATCQDRYGVDYACQAPTVRAKREATCKEKYGGLSPFCSEQVRQKAVDTIFQRYGVTNGMQSETGKAHYKQACIERYGSEWALSSPDVRIKIVATMLDRYGASSFCELPGFYEMSRHMMLLKYGADSPMHVPEIKERVYLTKRENNTFHTSAPEEILFEQLCDRFGKNDVIRQYKSEQYPFACDFYIKSRDLYIELNAFWSHGGHWFDEHDSDDLQQVAEWRRLAVDSNFYKNTLQVWIVSDVKKRQAAQANSLNYIVFWDSGLKDANLWFASGCPDGQDWDRPMSWFEI